MFILFFGSILLLQSWGHSVVTLFGAEYCQAKSSWFICQISSLKLVFFEYLILFPQRVRYHTLYCSASTRLFNFYIKSVEDLRLYLDGWMLDDCFQILDLLKLTNLKWISNSQYIKFCNFISNCIPQCILWPIIVQVGFSCNKTFQPHGRHRPAEEKGTENLKSIEMVTYRVMHPRTSRSSSLI